ncbi:SAF domain-containing protein [Pseudonocardia hydrocarbonoxydans]|uniref:SAF domain-containing protein n=1 Tax=Pseudonocardia hydrocarbonoxydans TaxID=76726 RepID=UPI0031E43497
MTVTAQPHRSGPETNGLRTSALPRRRSSRRLVLAVLLGVLGALLSAYAYQAALARQGAVALTRALPFGTTIQLSDLREVRLPGDAGLATIAWTDVDTVVGQLASTDLRAGQVVTPDSVTTERVPAPGEAVVGLAIEPGRAPSTPLEPRDAVLVVLGGGSPPRQAVVVRAGGPDVSGRSTVDVLVPQADAEELALASVAGQIAIVLVGKG